MKLNEKETALLLTALKMHREKLAAILDDLVGDMIDDGIDYTDNEVYKSIDSGIKFNIALSEKVNKAKFE